MDINNKDGWFFQNPQENKIHILTDNEINQLFLLSDQEEQWVTNVKEEVKFRDQVKSNNLNDFMLDEIRVLNTGGTVTTYPFGLSVITFPSRRHLFRGESQVYKKSLPSLNRKIQEKNDNEKILHQAIADMRVTQFAKFIWKINVVPYWEAKLSDVNYKALAQHYGFDTNYLDLTNDVRVALFFATCKYIPEIDSYKPLTKRECKERQYGVIFHTPDWRVDYFNGVNSFRLMSRMEPRMDQPLNIENGSCDGVAFQIGLQPLMRCHHQSGYILPMINDAPLQEDWQYEKLYIKLTPELSEQVFRMMDNGKKVFPNEGINEARPILDKIKNSRIFSEDDLRSAYERIGSIKYDSIEKFRTDIENLDIEIQKNEVNYAIPSKLLNQINDKYDNKNLLEPVDGIIHIKSYQQEYRNQKCIEIYGKLI